MSFISNLAKKVYSRGSHLAKKVRSRFLHGSSKVRHVLRDVQGFVDKVNRIAPFATAIVDDVTDLIPGVAPVKQGLKLGLSAFNTVSSLVGTVSDKVNKADSFARNPNVRNFGRIFDV